MSRHRFTFEHLEPNGWKEDPASGALLPIYTGINADRARGRQMIYVALRLNKAELAKIPKGPTARDDWKD